ncbi:MAG: LamG-like jellyroll fold domain-containing protein [Fuerstiella sp.]
MKHNSFLTRLAILCVGLTVPAHAADRHWSFNELGDSGFSVMGGDVTLASGLAEHSLALDGISVLQVKQSAAMTHDTNGFTCSIWVNPYTVSNGQQMIVAKNRYSLNEREWGVMIDMSGRYTLYVRQDGWSTLASEVLPVVGRWQHVAVAISAETARLWINGRSAGILKLAQPIPKTRAPLTFGGVNDNGRIRQNLFGALDEAVLFNRALPEDEIAKLYDQRRAAAETAKPHTPSRVEDYPLWSGGPIPEDPAEIPFAPGIRHQTLHDARTHDYKFLHGAAIIHYRGTFFANWANSPKNENQQFETMQGRRSTDGGRTWSEVEVIAPGFEGPERHSHGILMQHQGRLWTFAARFGKGTSGRRFPGLCAEAIVLNEQTDKWDSQGIVMTNCWPYDEPVRMDNGNFITGGQDKDGLPVVAISHGDDVTKWDSVLIPYDRRLQPSFAETTVTTFDNQVIAVIRGGGGVAWVSTSDDFGRTWLKARPGNLPMPRAKACLGKLSTGQLYLISNFRDRDTLVVSVGQPGEKTLSSMWKVRHGKSEPPRFPGAAKSSQWSYPYGYEHDGTLYIVYSIGKEDCGLSLIPISELSER